MSRVLILALSVILVLGCGSSNTELTKNEQASFKGAPMPDDARKKMNESIAAWQQKNSQSTPAPGPSASGSR